MPRSCRVTIQDMDGVSHTVEVTAATLYEPVAQGLEDSRVSDWLRGSPRAASVADREGARRRSRHRVPCSPRAFQKRPGRRPFEDPPPSLGSRGLISDDLCAFQNWRDSFQQRDDSGNWRKVGSGRFEFAARAALAVSLYWRHHMRQQPNSASSGLHGRFHRPEQE